MRRPAALLASILALTLAPLQAAAKPADPEAKLARALEGRVAGQPVDCLDLHRIRSSQIIDRTAILYETSGGTIYVNRPESGAQSLDSWDVLVTDTHNSRLCDIDVVRLFDSGSRMMTGIVFLGEFVPYKKVRSAR